MPDRTDQRPLADLCLHDMYVDGQGRTRYPCGRPPTSRRYLCSRHAAQHDRVRRDRARKKRTRKMQRRVRRA